MPRTASLPIFLEPGAGGSLQHQIYQSIRQSIVDGRAARGSRLPSTRVLATELGVSRNTALLALEQLRAEGYVVSRPGAGTFIAAQLPERAAAPVARASGAGPRPPFSRRGYLLARLPAPDRRLASAPPRAFRLGTPALDLFPHRLWAQLTRECVRSTSAAHRDYSALAGLPALREAIAEHVQCRGTVCGADQVQVVTGAQRGLDLVARMLLDPGDAALIEDPGYTGARGALLAAGAELHSVAVDGQGLKLRGDEVARVAYVTPSCQFPTGVAMSRGRRHALLDWARRSQAWVLEDDYDCDIRHDGQPLPCLHALDPDGRVIYLGTFSKTLFPALRLGFLIAPRELHDGLVAARLATDFHAPVLEQRVLAAFIERGHFARHLRRMRSAYAERLDALSRAVVRCGAPFSLRPVQAGMHAVIDVHGIDAGRLHSEALAHGIETMPLSAYYLGNAGLANALLLGFGAVRPAAIRAGINRLARLAERLGFHAAGNARNLA